MIELIDIFTRNANISRGEKLTSNEIIFVGLVALSILVTYSIHLLTRRTAPDQDFEQRQELLIREIRTRKENLFLLLDKADLLEYRFKELNADLDRYQRNRRKHI